MTLFLETSPDHGAGPRDHSTRTASLRFATAAAAAAEARRTDRVPLTHRKTHRSHNETLIRGNALPSDRERNKHNKQVKKVRCLWCCLLVLLLFVSMAVVIKGNVFHRNIPDIFRHIVNREH